MTPDAWLSRMLQNVDELAFALAHTPRQEEWLDGFADRVRAQWRQCFLRYMSAKDIDGMIADLVQRVRRRRDEIERFGKGCA